MKRAFPRLRLPQSETHRAVRPWGRYGHGGGLAAGNPACGVKSDVPGWAAPAPARLLPSRPVVSLSLLVLLPTPAADCRSCPVRARRGLRGLHYSIHGAMPACDEMIKTRPYRCSCSSCVQGCGRRPAASGTTAWARRRPGGGESARTSTPLTTPRFAATGLSPSSLPPPHSRCIVCFALLPSIHAVELSAQLPRASAAVRFINPCAFVGTHRRGYLLPSQSGVVNKHPRHYPCGVCSCPVLIVFL